MTVTPSVVREHYETDLGDDALDRLILDAYGAIDDRYGSVGDHSKTFDPPSGEYLFLDPPAVLVSSVTEDDTPLLDGEEYDFVLRFDGRALKRTNGRWWGETTVVWEVEEDPRRDRVVIDLVKLAVAYEGLASSGDGDYSETHPDYQVEREKILSELGSWTAFV